MTEPDAPSPDTLLALIAQDDQEGFLAACQRMTNALGYATWTEAWDTAAMRSVFEALWTKPGMQHMVGFWIKRLPSTACAEIWASSPADIDEERLWFKALTRRARPLDRARAAARLGQAERVERALAEGEPSPEDIASVRTMAALHRQWPVVRQLWSRGASASATIDLVWMMEDLVQRETLLQLFSTQDWLQLAYSTNEPAALDRAMVHISPLLAQNPTAAATIVQRIVMAQDESRWSTISRLPGLEQWGASALLAVMTDPDPQPHPWIDRLLVTFDLQQVVETWRQKRPMPWKAIDRLGERAPPEDREAWLKRWGSKLPRSLARERAERASPAPSPLRRPRPRP